MINEVYLIDCMKYMKTCKDNQFDLAIVDPPYGIGQDWKKDSSGQHYNKNTNYRNNKITDIIYFKELFRISKFQIIWGWNYYSSLLPSTNYIIIWDKMRDVKKTFRSECEQAWTNVRIPQRIYHIRWDGFKKGEETGTKSIHPHQKPILLYKKLLNDYAKPGYKIFDSHIGSGSIRIACHDLGFDLIGCEIDKDYWQNQEERYQNHTSQQSLFDIEEMQELIYE